MLNRVGVNNYEGRGVNWTGKCIARPLETITNVIWSFNTELHRPQLLLIKRADEPLKGHGPPNPLAE